MTVGQGLTALAIGAGGGCLDICTLIYPFSPLSPSLWETARYRLKYCLKGPLNPKQPTNRQDASLYITAWRPAHQSLQLTIKPSKYWDQPVHSCRLTPRFTQSQTGCFEQRFKHICALVQVITRNVTICNECPRKPLYLIFDRKLARYMLLLFWV